MASSLATLFLLSTAASVSGNSLKNAYHEVADAAQAPFTGGSKTAPLTINVRDDIDISHPAEKADVEISVQFCEVDRQAAMDATTADLSRLQSLFSRAGLDDHDASPITVRKGSMDDYEYRPRRRFSKDVDDEEKSEEEKHCATSILTVVFPDLERLPMLASNLTSETGKVQVNYIDWKLTEATQAAQNAELRRKALESLQAKGKDYAAAFGAKDITLVEFSEEYQYTTTSNKGRRHGRMIWYGDEDEADLSVRDVTFQAEVRAKFTI